MASLTSGDARRKPVKSGSSQPESPREAATRELREETGLVAEIDGSIVAAFEAILAAADSDYLTGKRSDFTLDAQGIYEP